MPDWGMSRIFITGSETGPLLGAIDGNVTINFNANVTGRMAQVLGKQAQGGLGMTVDAAYMAVFIVNGLNDREYGHLNDAD